jgi:signal transduction histidine kinase
MFPERFWHPTLRLRVLAPAALVAVPAIALLVYTSVDRRLQAENAVTQDAARVARLRAQQQERLIEGTRQLLAAVAGSRDVRDGDTGTCSAYLRQVVPQFGGTYTNLGILDSKGTLICSGLTAGWVSLADRPYFQRALSQKQFMVGEYVVGKETGQGALPMVYPLVTPAGDVSRVAFATVDLESLTASLGGDDWPADAEILITDRLHTVIAMYPDNHKLVGRSVKNGPVTRRIGTSLRGAFDFQERGATEAIAFERVRPVESGITVRVQILKNNARAAATWAMYQHLVAFSLVALIVLVVVKAASDRLLLQPIEELTQASRRLAEGDLGARVACSTTIPELNELGKTFDAMATVLEERETARLRVEMERKDLEQQYHQAQKMDAVGRLAGGIAHDFNNMLTAILGYCELLADDPSVKDHHRADIREIERAGKTAAQLTRQLLSFSRREIVEPTVLDLNAVVGGMDNMLHRLVGEHIDMRTTLAPHLESVKADRGQVEQVILNLVVNARDAMPDGGLMSIETANVCLPEGVTSAYLTAPPGHYVVLTVKDTGSGMTDNVLEHLFEPFFTTKRSTKGTGLGLATIYGILKQNDGGIAVESTAGAGSVFRIYFPSCSERPSDPLPQPTSARTSPDGTGTILIVEDDPGIRELSSKILKRCGYTVLVANGGHEARLICERHDGIIDLLLSDVVMPGMNGPTVAEMLTKMRPAMKVVFMSGYTDDAIVRHGVMERDVPFLQKPFTPERLANKIVEVLG